MSANDQTITRTSIQNATEIIKEMLRSPASEQFFGRYGQEVPIQRLLDTHDKIARHLSKLVSEADGESVSISDLPSSF